MGSGYSLINRSTGQETVERAIGYKQHAANLCKCWDCRSFAGEGGRGSLRAGAYRKLRQTKQLNGRSYELAAISLYAWKRHTLQDFQFPQRFPQQTTALKAQESAARSRKAVPKRDQLAVLTPKLPQDDCLDDQIARGPRKIRAGRNKIAASKANTPCTAMPRM